ncbi:MAG: LSM domain-containing protein [Thermoprotei archaeon]
MRFRKTMKVSRIENSNIQTMTPLGLIYKVINKHVNVRLKDNTLLYGSLAACDTNMNIILINAEEQNDNGETIVKYGKVFIRGNNILYVQVKDILI